MGESIVSVTELTRRFGARTALASVSLEMSRGAVYGLVGANGAGKTTLIKHILGLLRAESGLVRVFGLDPVADPVGVLSRVGYLSEEHDLPGWMSVDELLRYSRAFYPGWDDRYAEELRQAFALDCRWPKLDPMAVDYMSARSAPSIVASPRSSISPWTAPHDAIAARSNMPLSCEKRSRSRGAGLRCAVRGVKGRGVSRRLQARLTRRMSISGLSRRS